MSSIILPASTLESLDKVSRTFLWGGTTDKRKLHLLAWTKICKPKEEGGLGVRGSRDMNKALVAKVGWRLLGDDKSLWARVLRSKYKVGEVQNHSWLAPKSHWSSTWRSISTGLRAVVTCGLGWVPGDGRSINFWLDKWLLNTSLLSHATRTIPVAEINKKVEEYWCDGAGWNTRVLSLYLPMSIIHRLYAVVIKGCPGVRDTISWTGNSNGEFTVSSAYAMLTAEGSATMHGKVLSTESGDIWGRVKSVQFVKERWKQRFMYLGTARRCLEFGYAWYRDLGGIFFTQSLLEWLYDNLRSREGLDGQEWGSLFSIAVWWAWKWRCGNVFGEQGRCRDRVQFLKELAKDTIRSHHMSRGSSRRGVTSAQVIRWQLPSLGWVKLSTDGASHGNPGLATAGGVIRGEEGEWLGGFALNKGICSAPMAELWGVYYGLVIAWERGFRRVELEVDSKLVMGFLQTGVTGMHPLSFLVRLCHGFISRDWLVRVTHVYREANRLAD
ncbi:putative ribonuclease H domain-containing protein [Arabidopsis thaliana]